MNIEQNWTLEFLSNLQLKIFLIEERFWKQKTLILNKQEESVCSNREWNEESEVAL